MRTKDTRRGRRPRRPAPGHGVACALQRLEDRCLLSASIGPLPDAGPAALPGLAAVVSTFDSWASGDFASMDGTGNNPEHPDWGSAGGQLLRLTTAEYGDGVWTPAGQDRPGARQVSNAVAAQTDSIPNDRYLTDLLWMWGQFVDHDLDLTGNTTDPVEPMGIEVPAWDPYFDPFGTGTQSIPLARSVYDHGTGDSPENPRQQINEITAFIDGSMVYGIDADRAAALRAFEGGRLRTSDGDLLPFNDMGLPNAGGPGASLFLAGDVRANENVALSAMHTVWVREHNWWADQIGLADPALGDEQIYQRARTIVAAEIQAITFNQFLPTLLGPDAIGRYEGFDPTVNPGIANVFSTALFRLGHSLLPPELLRLGDDGSVIEDGNLSLREAFFAPQEILDEGIDSILRGASTQVSQELDSQIVDDVRNFLFGPPGAGGFDLVSLNIQRGRDHGLADYNQARVDLGLEPAASFSDITSDPLLQAALESVYGSVDDIDTWVGALAEDHIPGASVGELIERGVADQFERLRAGDRYWYGNIFSGQALALIDNTTFGDVIARNTEVSGLQENVFFSPSVLYHEAEDRHGAHMLVTADQESVSILDAHSQDLLASASVAQMSQVMVVGGDGWSDHVMIDVGTSLLSMPGGIVVSGGEGREPDVLTIMGTWGDDVITINGNQATVNGMAVTFLNIERVRIEALGGDDTILVGDDVAARVIVSGRHRGRAPDHRHPKAEKGHNGMAARDLPGRIEGRGGLIAEMFRRMGKKPARDDAGSSLDIPDLLTKVLRHAPGKGALGLRTGPHASAPQRPR